jgi:hypothetical protein
MNFGNVQKSDSYYICLVFHLNGYGGDWIFWRTFVTANYFQFILIKPPKNVVTILVRVVI